MRRVPVREVAVAILVPLSVLLASQAGAVDTVPLVTVNADPNSGDVPLTVQFSSSVNGGDGLLTYTWSFGDGELSSEPRLSHTYSSPGDYLVDLTVTDEDGDEGLDLVYVYVWSP